MDSTPLPCQRRSCPPPRRAPTVRRSSIPQVSRERVDAHLTARSPLNPITPIIDAKPTAALSPKENLPSKTVKKKIRNDDDLYTVVQNTPAASNDNAGDVGDDTDGDDTETNFNTDWIGVLVDKPRGERGRADRTDRRGWDKARILRRAGITEAQYHRYMASISLILSVELLTLLSRRNPRIGFVTVTLMSQRSSQRMRYFTRQNIVLLSKRYVQSAWYFSFANSDQMKELHPRFNFHTGNWLTRHFVMNHCQVKSKSFANLGVDPDVKIYQNYKNRLKQDFKKRQLYPSRSKGIRQTRPMDEVRHPFGSIAFQSKI